MFVKRLAVALAVLGFACGGGDKTTATCVPGASVACVCGDNSTGAQVCTPDGTFAACSCASQGSAGQTGADTVGRDAGREDTTGGGGAVVTGADAGPLVRDSSTGVPDLLPGPEVQFSDASVFSPTRGTRCDDKGNCHCVAIASIGQPAAYGPDSGSGDIQNVFQDYLNTKSNATVKMFTEKPSINADFLKDYDLIILQAMVTGSLQGGSTPWTISDDEVKAVEEWVRAGHSIISMSGYQGASSEVNPLNKLLSFTGISYNKDDIYPTSEADPYFCRYGSAAFNGWKSPMDFGMKMDDRVTLGGMKAVGVFYGRSLNCSDCDVWAEDSKVKLGVSKKVGDGRVFAWADEWVTYTSQWGLPGTDDKNANRPECDGYLAAQIYAVPQFWYNAIANVVSDDLRKCFKIEDVIVY